jgi:hypothetical protein
MNNAAADAGVIIRLVGFAGAGKLPIARAPSRPIDATIVDNHRIDDPVLRLVATRTRAMLS